jgi:hypothetical protein
VRSSGTANARRRRGSRQRCARERTLAAQLGELDQAAARAPYGRAKFAPVEGVADPSAARLQFVLRAYVGAHREVAPSGRKAALGDRAATRSFAF